MQRYLMQLLCLSGLLMGPTVHADLPDAEVTIDVIGEQATPGMIYHEIRLPQPAAVRAGKHNGDAAAAAGRSRGDAARERAQEAAAERWQQRAAGDMPGNRPVSPPGQEKN